MSVYNNDLAARLHENDINAFNTLYWKYHGAVYANTLKLIRDAVIAEDIVQEVFITLWEKRHAINKEKDISGWLFVTSYNKSIDQLKRKLRDSLAKEHLEIKTDIEADVNNDLTDVRLSTLEKAMPLYYGWWVEILWIDQGLLEVEHNVIAELQPPLNKYKKH